MTSRAATPGTGKLRFIEVKGRVSGAATITVTKNEILYSLNKPEDFILAIVEFLDGDAHRVHYVRQPFQREPDFGVTSVNYDFRRAAGARRSFRHERTGMSMHDPEEETDRSRSAAGRDQQGQRAGEVDPPRAPEHAAPLVGAAAAGGGAGGDLRADGGRPVGPSRTSSRPRRRRRRNAQRLFRIIEDLVLWENTTNETVLQQARDEIWQSWRYTCAENADHPRAKELFDRHKLPAFHDPFAGGGALPLEAQRLGLESYASDLNPVAVLINKAMIEIPPKFAGKPPVNPETRKRDRKLFEQDVEGRAGAGRGRALLRPVDARRGREAHRPPLPEGRDHGRDGEGAAGP